MRNSNKKYKLKDRQTISLLIIGVRSHDFTPSTKKTMKDMEASTIYRNELRTYSAFDKWAERHPGAFNAILIADVVAGVIALFLCV